MVSFHLWSEIYCIKPIYSPITVCRSWWWLG
jgi:hypothetical protein